MKNIRKFVEISHVQTQCSFLWWNFATWQIIFAIFIKLKIIRLATFSRPRHFLGCYLYQHFCNTKKIHENFMILKVIFAIKKKKSN